MSEADVAEDFTTEPPLTVGPGDQLLLEVNGRQNPLDALPDAAFENLVVVTTRQTPGQIETAVSERRGSVDGVGVVPITASVLEYDGPLWTTERVPPSDLTGISIRVSQAFSNLEPDRGWLVFDSISTLLMYTAEDRCYRLFDWLVTNTRSQSVRGVYTLQSDVVAERTRRHFRMLCDDVGTV